MKKAALLPVLLAAVLLLAGCPGGGQKEKASVPSGEKVVVYASVFPLFDFARNIGGERVQVLNLMPPGSDPHHWEPTPGDLVKISKSGVFLYCGAGLESWVDGALKNIDQNRLVVVDSSRGVQLLTISAEDGHEQEEKNGEEEKNKGGEAEDHGHSGVDPHIWLDPLNAGVMVDNILAGLVKADPAGREYYSANAERYKAGLVALDKRYRAALEGAKVKEFVVSHAAFGYLARRYRLNQVPIRGLTADTEPSPARMAEIVNLVRRQGIKYIFFEPTVSPKVSEAIARETGAGILVLNPIAGITEKQINDGKDYLSLMEENLENLITASQAR